MSENEKLKQVRYLEIFNLKDLYSGGTREIVHEAIMLDETLVEKPKQIWQKKKMPLSLKVQGTIFPKF